MSVRPGLIVKPAKLLRTDSIGCIGLVIDPTSAVLPMPQAFTPQVQSCGGLANPRTASECLSARGSKRMAGRSGTRTLARSCRSDPWRRSRGRGKSEDRRPKSERNPNPRSESALVGRAAMFAGAAGVRAVPKGVAPEQVPSNTLAAPMEQGMRKGRGRGWAGMGRVRAGRRRSERPLARALAPQLTGVYPPVTGANRPRSHRRLANLTSLRSQPVAHGPPQTSRHRAFPGISGHFRA
jgi:hypothetical protein